MKALGAILGGLAAVSGWMATSASSFIQNNPRAPDYDKGYTIPLAVRGLGTRYISQAQWETVAPYWHIFYGILGVLILFLIVWVVSLAYQSFMQGWRSDDKNDGLR
jgi:hypothetical protein